MTQQALGSAITQGAFCRYARGISSQPRACFVENLGLNSILTGNDEDITGIAVSTSPDLSHYPPLFQLKSSEVFIKSPEVSIKSSEVSTKSSGLFLYLFPAKQKKL